MPVIPEGTAPGALTQAHPKRHLKVCPKMTVEEYRAHTHMGNSASFYTCPLAPLRGLAWHTYLNPPGY